KIAPLADAGSTSVKVFGPYGPMGLFGNGKRLKKASPAPFVGNSSIILSLSERVKPDAPVLNRPRCSTVGTAKCDSLLALMSWCSADAKKNVFCLTIGPPKTNPYCPRVY